MQLTRHADYALRLLISLAGAQDQRVLIADVAEAHDISRTHLMKVANALARLGYIVAVRGRGGGIRLSREPSLINVGEVVRAMEPGNSPVNCSGCRLLPHCRLPGIFCEAMDAFFAVLNRYSLADLLKGPPALIGQRLGLD